MAIYTAEDYSAMLVEGDTAFLYEGDQWRVEVVKTDQGFSFLKEGDDDGRRIDMDADAVTNRLQSMAPEIDSDDIEVNLLLEPYVIPEEHPVKE